MRKCRLEAFSDDVIAILITNMVLELKVPRGRSLADLAVLLPLFLTYVLSFVFLEIYWRCGNQDQWEDTAGQHAPAVLAFTDSLKRGPAPRSPSRWVRT
jgi:uncharacterized membrane protein